MKLFKTKTSASKAIESFTALYGEDEQTFTIANHINRRLNRSGLYVVEVYGLGVQGKYFQTYI